MPLALAPQAVKIEIRNSGVDAGYAMPPEIKDSIFNRMFDAIPRKLKCAGCQVGDHCNGEDDGCYCECTDQRV